MEEQPSKKRQATSRLDRDALDDDDEEGGDESGAGGEQGFARANESVLATRRIVKARRRGIGGALAPQSGAAGPSSNPFASVSLLAPVREAGSGKVPGEVAAAAGLVGAESEPEPVIPLHPAPAEAHVEEAEEAAGEEVSSAPPRGVEGGTEDEGPREDLGMAAGMEDKDEQAVAKDAAVEATTVPAGAKSEGLVTAAAEVGPGGAVAADAVTASVGESAAPESVAAPTITEGPGTADETAGAGEKGGSLEEKGDPAGAVASEGTSAVATAAASAAEGTVGPTSTNSKPVQPSSFASLSSAPNAFSGSFGGGFPSSGFSFPSSLPAAGNTAGTGGASTAGFSSGFSFGGGSLTPFSFGSGSALSGSAAPSFSFLSSSANPQIAFGANSSSGLSSLSSSGFGAPAFGTTPFGLAGNGANSSALAGSSAGGVPLGDEDSLPSGGGGGPTTLTFPPAVTLTEVPLETGEESESSIFVADAGLFEFVEAGKWKERGRGEVRLNLPVAVQGSAQRPARLVMRAKGNFRLLLNANLFPDMKVTRMDGRALTFACANSASANTGVAATVSSSAAPGGAASEGEATGASGSSGGAGGGLSTFAVRLRDEARVVELLQAMEAHKGRGGGGAEGGEEAKGDNAV